MYIISSLSALNACAPTDQQTDGPIKLESLPLPVLDKSGLCGSAAVEFVARRFDVDPTTSELFKKLSTAQSASLLEMRMCLKEYGFQVHSFEIDSQDISNWNKIDSLTNLGVVQVILRIPTIESNSNIESGHYVLFEGISRKTIFMLDPLSRHHYEIDIQDLKDLKQPIVIQVVYNKEAKGSFHPTSTDDLIAWLPFPALALLALFWRVLHSHKLPTKKDSIS